MHHCEQARGQSVWQHGQAVEATFDTLMAVLEGTAAVPEGWRLPAWLLENASEFLTRLAARQDLRTYQLYHDCGKPYCMTTDEDGKRHFPDHATVSSTLWRELGGSDEVALLMLQDMDVHLLKAEGVPEFSKRPQAASLFLTGLAEVHANAPMFGGFDSSSFKAKVKNLERRGKALLGVWAPGC